MIAFLFVLILALRVRKLRVSTRSFARGAREGHRCRDRARMRQIEAIDRRVDGVVKAQASQAAVGRHALQKFGIVRYDAFEGWGGGCTFSAAFLDDHGDGVVFTSINGRTETRTYAKPVTALASDYNLSEEERSAIAAAAADTERTETAAPVSR